MEETRQDAINTETVVLRCPRCRKPFDNSSSLKRHGYYCRTRKTLDQVSRARSCLGCAASKAGCDRKHPICSRCLHKGVECKYSGKRTAGSVQAITRSPDAHDSSRSLDSDLPQSPGLVSGQPGQAVPPVVFGGLELLWDDLDLVKAPHEHVASAPTIAPTTTKDLTSPISHSPFGSSDLTYLAIATLPSHLELIPRTLGMTPSNSRSLIRRPRQTPGSQRAANLIWHTLKSYPHSMMNSSTLPPFIHPQTARLALEDPAGVEPLHNCLSLLPMLRSDTGLLGRGHRDLFWRNVRWECERLCAEFSTLSPLGIVSALQALSIYIIVRVGEVGVVALGEDKDDSIDGLLVMTVVIMSSGLARAKLDNSEDSAVSSAADVSSQIEEAWRRWILGESARRLCILYQVVNMVAIFEPATRCDLSADGLVLAPLPAARQLWEAPDAERWMAERNKLTTKATAHGPAGLQTSARSKEYGMATNGDLVVISPTLPVREQERVGEGGERAEQEREEDGPEARIDMPGRWPRADWEDWMTSMDGFGGLIMLAASLRG